jgi:hypothetical protein
MPARPGQPAPPGRPVATGAATDKSGQVLDDAEAHRRLLVLAALQASLADLGIASTLARKHRLVLGYTDGTAGLTDPELHVLGPGQVLVATTDGTVYRLGSAREYPADDPAAAAMLISREFEPAAAAPAPPK